MKQSNLNLGQWRIEGGIRDLTTTDLEHLVFTQKGAPFVESIYCVHYATEYNLIST